MVDRHATDILAGMANELANTPHPPTVKSGHAVATEVVRLMDRAATRIPPLSLIQVYVDAGGGTSRAVLDKLWAAYGAQTIETLCDGTVTLASIWESAWKKGGGEATFSDADVVGLDPGLLQACYLRGDFVPSLDLDNIGAVLKG